MKFANKEFMMMIKKMILSLYLITLIFSLSNENKVYYEEEQILGKKDCWIYSYVWKRWMNIICDPSKKESKEITKEINQTKNLSNKIIIQSCWKYNPVWKYFKKIKCKQ